MGARGARGPYGAQGPMGPYGALWGAGGAGPYGARGPMGPYGALWGAGARGPEALPPAGREKGRCVASEYFLEPEINLVTENTENILKTVRTATPFPMVSLFLVFHAFVISNVGHIAPSAPLLAFRLPCIFFILSGLSLVVGLVLYISSINDEVMNRPSGSEQYFQYRYGWSFAFAASSFLLKEGAGVMSVYLFTKRYAEEELCRAPAALLRPRLSACSGLSGQFLQPRAWPRARSPSDASSDVSIQMTQNYPPAIKYPQHGHLSTSPC
ncbi:LOW QUALITY PROTEIN: voltage-dependent calcium channel gamma-7 subunit-like [Phalacrocorax carbo]|uniref:LOW QUALITY PROTEIN: voltage-dependent calcium channel gamma-7 subunit-like n=1 Tax=Phalacrocorax carbo TaxID=9209 RepID=UPI003119A05C